MGAVSDAKMEIDPKLSVLLYDSSYNYGKNKLIHMIILVYCTFQVLNRLSKDSILKWIKYHILYISCTGTKK